MATFSFSFTTVDYLPPFLRNHTPGISETGVDGDTSISVDILDESNGVDIDTIDAYMNGVHVFNGPSTFLSPWNGAGSAIGPTTVDGYDGYSLVLVGSAGTLPARTDHTVRIIARDTAGLLTDESWTFRTGMDIQSLVEGTFEIDLVLTFGGEMTVNSDLFEPANYVFNNGMYVRLVELIDNQSVRLWTEFFHSNDTFQLAVGSNVLDSYGDALPSSYNTVDISPFKSDANIGNFNGLIRTKRVGNVILADSQRIYVAGSRGIDVFRKETSSIPRRFGQVFDGYNITAMFVANFPGALQIVDGEAPFLSNQSPAPNTSTTNNTSIAFSIEDRTTAVEITSTTIYVNNDVAFRGGFEGWSNNYKGNIVISYRTLNFTIKPPTVFSLGDVVSVRVVASDLLGNQLDTTYYYIIGTDEITEGWGGDEWGFSGWGGID